MKNQFAPSNLFLLSVILVFILIVVVVVLYLNMLSVFHPEMAIVKCVERFQSLIAGVLALFSAIVASLYARMQIKQNDMIEDERRRRKSFAGRSVLSLVLSSICDHACNVARLANEIHEHRLQHFDSNARSNFSYSYTNEEIDIIKECVEHADESSMHILNALVRRIQYTQSRVNGIMEECCDRGVTPYRNWENFARDRMRDALKLYSEASNIFQYADGKKDSIQQKITHSQLKSSLNVLSHSPNCQISSRLGEMVSSENFFSQGYDVLEEHLK